MRAGPGAHTELKLNPLSYNASKYTVQMLSLSYCEEHMHEKMTLGQWSEYS